MAPDTRYFMIKSWNHENVVTAMRDGLWATQEKNAALLAEAFQTSRHVVLLFSVNKSVAFQGYVSATPRSTVSIGGAREGSSILTLTLSGCNGFTTRPSSSEAALVCQAELVHVSYFPHPLAGDDLGAFPASASENTIHF